VPTPIVLVKMNQGAVVETSIRVGEEEGWVAREDLELFMVVEEEVVTPRSVVCNKMVRDRKKILRKSNQSLEKLMRSGIKQLTKPGGFQFKVKKKL
jgi:hypothetical protein